MTLFNQLCVFILGLNDPRLEFSVQVKQVVALQEGLLLERATAPGEITGQRR